MAFLILGANIVVFGLVLVNMLFWPRVGRGAESSPRAVSVLIPARNEEDNLAPCLDAVLAQGDAVAEVLVYDDHSTDGTAAVVARYAVRDRRVSAVPAEPLPDGWCGKPFACDRLAASAASPWLLFLDADARLLPGAVTRIAAEAERRRATLLSCWPGLHLGGFWEKLCMPLLNFSVFTLYPAPVAFRTDDAKYGLAHGACMLADRDAYRRTGGHAAVRDEIFEDTRLARHWRKAGERSLCLDGQDVVRVRMYDSLAGIWNGFQKNFYPAFQHERNFWLFFIFHAACFFVPFVFAPTGIKPVPTWCLSISAALVLLGRFAMALRFRYPWWSPLLHPFAEALLLLLGLASWRRCVTGRGVEWKGRRYRDATPLEGPR
jgi:glycosyltransferase involved in cell wall biosynthesis